MDPLSGLQSQRTDIQTHSFGREDISNTSKIHFSKYDAQNETYLDWDIYTYTYMKQSYTIQGIWVFLEFFNT